MWRSRNKWFAGAGCVVAACLIPPKPAGLVASDGHTPSSEHNVIENAGFDGGKSLPWTSSFSEPGAGKVSVDSGELCTEITAKGKNNWDVQVRQRGMVIRKGHHYKVAFRARSTAPTTIRPKVGMQGSPYTEHWFAVVPLGTQSRTYSDAFTMERDDDPTAELAFHMGGPLAGGSLPVTVCIDDVVLEDPEFVRGPAPPPEPERHVLVDQVGYLPTSAKVAVIRSDETDPIAWELRDREGRKVARGETTVFGHDAMSGDHVHLADFTSVSEPGEGYELVAGGESSLPFAIRADLYRDLARDALRYFFHNRSGIAIAMPYAGGKQWARPAGHTSDAHARCLPGSHCDYTLDASRGWYDAGDHGKYVVNGGIAVWTLLDLYERAQRAGVRRLGDDLNIPESGNGVPDVLDEARWELEFMLGMQVPDGRPLAGMAHHKIHDETWTAIPTAPHADPKPRYLHPPTTAATLNLAAVAAQAARVYDKIDPAFANKCLRAAERAWQAAAQHPALYASEVVKGGGPYGDHEVADEMYWAAAELYVTTGKDAYRAALAHSPLHTKKITGAMTWQDTAVMGAISLALAERDPELRASSRARIVAAADHLLAVGHAQGYRLPFAGEDGQYPWGSSSFVLNNAILLALAHDFTGNAKYRDGVTAALDYILGENPLARSYVTGYGSRPIQNPHHRFWAHQADPAFPSAPPGALSGGPDSHLEDPYVQAAGMKGCAPERCHQDNIESYSTNEVAINWNAALAWVAAYLTSGRDGGADR
jgi:endoglucanase